MEGSGLDWVSWHGCRANAGNKSVSVTWSLSSSDIPLCSHQFPTNKDVWEEKRSDHSRCQGEMHLVSVEICQVEEVDQEWFLMSAIFISKVRFNLEKVPGNICKLHIHLNISSKGT